MKIPRGINEQEVVELVIDFWRNHEIQNKEGSKEQGVTIALCLRGGKKGYKASDFQKEIPLLWCSVLYNVRK